MLRGGGVLCGFEQLASRAVMLDESGLDFEMSVDLGFINISIVLEL